MLGVWARNSRNKCCCAYKPIKLLKMTSSINLLICYIILVFILEYVSLDNSQIPSINKGTFEKSSCFVIVNGPGWYNFGVISRVDSVFPQCFIVKVATLTHTCYLNWLLSILNQSYEGKGFPSNTFPSVNCIQRWIQSILTLS